MTRAKAAEIYLVFTEVGTAILEDEDGDVIWSSDDDEEFREFCPDEFLGKNDIEKIGEYLLRKGIMDEDDLIAMEIEIEGQGPDDDDEDDDDDDEIDSDSEDDEDED